MNRDESGARFGRFRFIPVPVSGFRFRFRFLAFLTLATAARRTATPKVALARGLEAQMSQRRHAAQAITTDHNDTEQNKNHFKQQKNKNIQII